MKELPVSVAVLDDPDLAAAIATEWEVRGEGDVSVETFTAGEWLSGRGSAADLIVFPSTLTGELVKRRKLAPLSDTVLQDPNFMLEDIQYQIRAATMTWDGKVIAAPFGSAQPVLMYRADALEAIGVQPPTTWQELAEVKAALEQDPASWGGPPGAAGLAEPLGPSWAAPALLVRAAAYATDANQASVLWSMENFRPRIAAPPWVRALEEMCVCWSGDPSPLETAPTDALLRLYRGQTAMALTWPQAAAAEVAADRPYLDRIRIAPPPGARQQYDWRNQQWMEMDRVHRVPVVGYTGRVGAVARAAANRPGAAGMLAWLTGAQSSAQVSSASRFTAPFRDTHREVAGRWIGDVLPRDAVEEYFGVLEQLNARGPAVRYPRLPGWMAYQGVLDEAVRRAVQGQASPAEALQDAAEQWETLTREQGRPALIDALRQSLDL